MKRSLQRLRSLISPTPKTMTSDVAVSSYGQEQSGLHVEDFQPIMEWVFMSLFHAKYSGEAHLFWMQPETNLTQKLQRLHRKGEAVLGYRCGDRMAPAPDGLYWRMVTEHESTRIYQLEHRYSIQEAVQANYWSTGTELRQADTAGLA